ncbi:unnamed protein product [Dracunculus medinensis]|uniref:Exportin-T n=1 Tax=Dracunculus medinensis TaxID=318479 RepID=A0A0N4U3L2_DRAME|nr:unnamed protein product [Dracunculus medinensis]
MAFGVKPLSTTEFAHSAELYEYIESLKSDPNGNVEEHFILLHVLEIYLSNIYPNDASDQDVIKLWMMNWMDKLCSLENPYYLCNKMAQLFALVFAADFPTRWPDFIHEIFLQKLNCAASVEFFLRTLIALDAEVVDQDINRTKLMLDRNAQIKDAMREYCINDIAGTWINFLNVSSGVKIRELCLEVITCYVDWIDIHLVVNDATIPLIIACAQSEETSEAATHALCAIIEKGMSTEEKFKLVKAFLILFQEKKLFSTNADNVDLIIHTGLLVNTIALSLIDCYYDFLNLQQFDRVQECLHAVNSLLQPMLFCFSSENMEVSQTILDFLRRYIGLFKNNVVNPEFISFLRQVAIITLNKFEAPDNFNFENDGEEELDFFEYRKQLKSLLTTIGAFAPDEVLRILEENVKIFCDNWQQMKISQIETILRLTSILSEIFCNNFANCVTDAAIRAKNLILQVLSSNVTCCGISFINELFFDISSRYEKLLISDPKPLNSILEAFLDNRGLRHPSSRLRTRCAYLFCRFVKTHKKALGDRSQIVLSSLTDFLGFSSTSGFLTYDDQKCIYEAISALIIHGSLNNGMKKQYITELLNSLLKKFLDGMDRLEKCENTEERQLIYQFLCNVVGYSARVAKPFSSEYIKNCDCAEIFSRLISVYQCVFTLSIDKVLFPIIVNLCKNVQISPEHSITDLEYLDDVVLFADSYNEL